GGGSRTGDTDKGNGLTPPVNGHDRPGANRSATTGSGTRVVNMRRDSAKATTTFSRMVISP
ncbi:MAG TPA: hypothetical protein VFR18_02275, partial [Terriglobia bacterium]|nr:hypothetical protein [Terriglobia bacterium]